jgi:RNA polymerase sigma-70 factor (ECF subfamily)
MVCDSELIRDAQNGDTEALEQLLRRYQGRIFSYLVRMLGNRRDAEDATQETFVNAIRALKDYREQGQFKSWLFQIAYREGLKVVKKRKSRRETAQDSVAEIISDALSPREQIINKERRQLLETAIQELSDAERQVVLLRLYEDMPFKEIAKIIDRPLNTALNRMHSATAKLRKKLLRMS